MITGKAILMHKNIKVAECIFDKHGYLIQISKIFNQEHMPVIAQKNSLLNLQKWLSSRCTHKDRADLAELRDFYGVNAFIPRYYASLFDTYWFQTDAEDTWEKISLFRSFSHDKDVFDKMLVTPRKMIGEPVNRHSPNLTIPGKEERIWYREGDEFFLLSAEAKKTMEEYKLAKHSFPVTKKSYMIRDGRLFSRTPMFVSENTEYIPFEEYYILHEKNKKHTRLQRLYDCCEYFNIPEWKEFFDMLFEYDDVTENDSRELYDIGVLRDADTLEIKGFHPL